MKSYAVRLIRPGTEYTVEVDVSAESTDLAGAVAAEGNPGLSVYAVRRGGFQKPLPPARPHLAERRIDSRDRNWECPRCGGRLCKGAFCVHFQQGTGDIEEIFELVPLNEGETLAARSARFDPAISQPAPNQIGA